MLGRHIFHRVNSYRYVGQGYLSRVRVNSSGSVWATGYGMRATEIVSHNLILQRGTSWTNHDYNGRGYGLFDIFPISTSGLNLFENSWDYNFNGSTWSDVAKLGAVDAGMGGYMDGTSGSDILLVAGGSVSGGLATGTAYWYRYNGVVWTQYSQVVGTIGYPNWSWSPVAVSLSPSGTYWATFQVSASSLSETYYALVQISAGNSATVIASSTPGPNPDYGYFGVYAVSDLEVYFWKVKVTGASPSSVYVYNGSSLTSLGTPVLTGGGLASTFLHGTSGSDLWVGGSRSFYIPIVSHYNGSSWTTTDLPFYYSTAYGAQVQDIRSLSTTSVWAVGYEYDSHGVQVPMTWHYNGTAWTAIPVF